MVERERERERERETRSGLSNSEDSTDAQTIVDLTVRTG
jgi:hypothetical protein